MGIIDSVTYKITCRECEIEEVVKILDKGSNWGGSHWRWPSELSKFIGSWEGGGGKQEPELRTAACKTCGKAAAISKNY